MSKHPTNWDRHAILAEIKRRFGSLRELADQSNVTASELSAALSSAYPKADKVIAKAIDVPLGTLWPDRYWSNGRRRLPDTRPQASGASQNAQAGADGGRAQP